MLRAQAPISAVPEVLKTINRSRYRSPRPRPSVRSNSLDIRKKFTPQVNKSFTSYHDVPLSPSRRLRSLSVERSRNISLGEIRPPPDRRKLAFSSRHRNLKSTGRLEGQSGDSQPYQLMERGNSELRSKQFPAAIKCFKRVLRDEPTHLDAMYNRAICYMHLGQHKMAIPDLLTVSKENPLYDRQLYIALAMCFVAGGDVGTAVRQLSKGLTKFPKFYEGLITRGKLYAQLQRWDKSVEDFYHAVSLDSSSGEAYLGLGDSFRGLGELTSAAQAYAKAAENKLTLVAAMTKRSKMYQEAGQLQQAIADLNFLLSRYPDHTESYFAKAQMLLTLGDESEAGLAFEQTIKYDREDKTLTGAALYQLSLIKIRQKDFYGAMFTLRRARDPKTQFKDQQVLKSYAEAVLSLMKRKFKEAIAQLGKLIKKRWAALAEFEASLFAFRGYGYFSLHQHGKALRDFRASLQLGPGNVATSYNKAVSSGIVAAESGDCEGAMRYFDRALKLFPNNMEPLAYKALALLLPARNNGESRTEDAHRLLDAALERRPAEAELYFLRAALHYAQDNSTLAVPDLEQAIEKAEDNVPAHYVLRGLCYARLRLFQEALQDFSIAIQLDEKLAQAYFFRGRIAFLLEDASLAFLDFQKLILSKQDDPQVHIHAGDLLMLTGSFEDAAKAFTNANEIRPTPQAYLQRCKCRLLLGQLPLAISDIGKAAQDDCDKELLTAIKEAADGSPQALAKAVTAVTKLQGRAGAFCNDCAVLYYRGTWLLAMQEFQKALQALEQAAENDEPSVPHAEVLFNLALCCLLLQRYERAMRALEQLPELMPHAQGKLLLLTALAKSCLHEDAREMLAKAELLDEHVSLIMSGSAPLTLSGIGVISLPPLEWRGPSFSIRVSVCCCLPRPPLPSFSFGVEAVVYDYFTMKALKSKPEAPWLNRVNGTIQFTEDMQDITSECVSDSEDAALADLREERASPDEDAQEEPRKWQSAVCLHAAESSSGDLPSKRTAELLGKLGKM